MEAHTLATVNLSPNPHHQQQRQQREQREQQQQQQQQYLQYPQNQHHSIHDNGSDRISLARYPETLPHHDFEQEMPRGVGHSGLRLPTPEAKHKRAPKACEACRASRMKCGPPGQIPCVSCMNSNKKCIFLAKGQHSNARNERHPRLRDRAARAGNKRSSAQRRRSNWELDQSVDARLSAVDIWHLLPPLDEMVDAVNIFTSCYFQLGFIHKDQYRRSIGKQHRPEHLFLLLSVLSISARLSPALTKRYGTGTNAAEFFKENAAKMADARYKHISLEDCQAFYLLSIAQQGAGEQNDSHRNLVLAIHKAAALRLHREERVSVLPDATPDEVIRKESARRTFWMLYSQDSLHSGPELPKSFCEIDITALLPSDEASFLAGNIPETRAALHDTVPGINKSLVHNPSRSLFATQIQVHHWWGKVRRRATTYSQESASEAETSEMISQLADWKLRLPQKHKWDIQIYRQMKAEGLDLAYLGVMMMIRVCNILIRRSFLQSMVNYYTSETRAPQACNQTRVDELFDNVFELYEQVEARFTGRQPNEKVGHHLAVFCVYLCGLHIAYMCKYHQLCTNRAIVDRAPAMFARTRAILQEYEPIWPFAKQWAASLDAAAQDPSSVEGHSMVEEIEPEPRVSDTETVLSAAERRTSFASHPTQQQASQEDVASSFSNSTVGYSPFSNARPPVDYPPSTFPLQDEANLMHSYFSPEPPPQQQHHHHHHQHQDGLNMLIQTSQSTNPAHPPHTPQPYLMASQPHFDEYVPPYDMATASAVAAATGEVSYFPGQHHQQQHVHTPVYHQLAPMSDGFDQQLACYVNGTSTDWHDGQQQPSGWMEFQQ